MTCAVCICICIWCICNCMWHVTLQEKFIVCCSHQRLERSYLLLNSPQIQIICDSYMRSRVGETKYCLSQDQGMYFKISMKCICICWAFAAISHGYQERMYFKVTFISYLSLPKVLMYGLNWSTAIFIFLNWCQCHSAKINSCRVFTLSFQKMHVFLYQLV